MIPLRKGRETVVDKSKKSCSSFCNRNSWWKYLVVFSQLGANFYSLKTQQQKTKRKGHAINITPPMRTQFLHTFWLFITTIYHRKLLARRLPFAVRFCGCDKANKALASCCLLLLPTRLLPYLCRRLFQPCAFTSGNSGKAIHSPNCT